MTGRFRWTMAALLFGANAINYLDRTALPIVAPVASRDLHLDPARLGLVLSAFFVGYAPFCLVGGWASDRFGPRRVFAIAMVWWSVFCGLTAAATGLASLLVLRVLFGIGEGPMGTTTNKTIRSWFPRREAGFVVGLTNAGNPIGGAIAGPLVGLVAVACGWRLSFLVVACLGLVWVAFWIPLATDTPDGNARVGPAERALIASGRPAAPSVGAGGVDVPVGRWLRDPAVLAVALAFFSYNYVLYFFLGWLPSYLAGVHHLDLRHSSLLAAIPWVCGSVGMLLGGAISDGLYRRTGRAIRSRKRVLVVGLLLTAVAVFAASRADGLAGALALIACANLFLLMAPQNCWVLVQEIVPEDRIGTVGGYVHLLANIAGIVGPALTGALVQYGGGYGTAFVLAAAVALAGALAVGLAVRDRAPPAEPAAETAATGGAAWRSR